MDAFDLVGVREDVESVGEGFADVGVDEGGSRKRNKCKKSSF